jgi:pyruvate kinase
MSDKPTDRLLERITEAMIRLKANAVRMGQSYADELVQIEPEYRYSAQNLLHYLCIRQQDIRALQEDLAGMGLSSLGAIEAHTLASLNAVINILEQLSG